MLLAQIGIVVFGVLSVWFVGRKESWSRWGFVFGLLSEPFWVYETISKEQWGILALTLFYAYAWGQGIYNNFIKGE